MNIKLSRVEDHTNGTLEPKERGKRRTVSSRTKNFDESSLPNVGAGIHARVRVRCRVSLCLNNNAVQPNTINNQNITFPRSTGKPPRKDRNAQMPPKKVVARSDVASTTRRAETLKSTTADPSTIKIELHTVQDDRPAAAPVPKASTITKKTKSPEEQRAANAAKPSKSSDVDLPPNIRPLLAGTGDILSGKSIGVTGVPPTLQRKNAEKLVQIYGGKLLKAVSKSTNFVVVGNDAGPKKLELIEEYDIETMDEDEFVKLLEDSGAGVKRATDGVGNPKGKRQKR